MAKADGIRNGKYYGQMTKEEVEAVSNIYPEQESEALKSVELDGYVPENWEAYSVAATFNGDERMSLLAFMTAEQLYGSHLQTAFWGLEINDPKWGGSDKAKTAYANAVADDPKVIGTESIGVAKALEDHGYKDLAKKVRTREINRVQVFAVAPDADPKDIFELATDFGSLGMCDAAVMILVRAHHLHPKNGYLMSQATYYSVTPFTKGQAINDARKTLEVDPDSSQTLALLAFHLQEEQTTDEVESLCRRALSVNSGEMLAAYTLCQQYVGQARWKEATEVLGTPEQLNDIGYWGHILTQSLGYSPRKYLALCKVWIRISPKKVESWESYADAYHGCKEYKNQLTAARDGLAHFPKDAGLYLKLGEGYRELGDKIKARQYYNRALEIAENYKPEWVPQIQEGIAAIDKPPTQNPGVPAPSP